MRIKLKENVDLEFMNKELQKYKLENKFCTKEQNEAWLKDINENPDSPQNHLKPSNRNLTMEELIKTFRSWTEIGLVEFDLYFDRTTEEEILRIVKYLEEHQDKVSYIDEVEMIIERGNIPQEFHTMLYSLVE